MRDPGATYRVQLPGAAEREFDRLPIKVIRQIRGVIEALKSNPRPQGCKKLKGQKPELWRVYSGRYRILYSIDDAAKAVWITNVGHRKDVYRGLP